MLYEFGAVALVGLAVWLAGKRWPTAHQNRSTRWRFVPLATALVLVILTFATFGAGVLLAPIALAVTLLSARRSSSPRGSAFYLGATLSGVLMLGFVSMIAIIASEALGN